MGHARSNGVSSMASRLDLFANSCVTDEGCKAPKTFEVCSLESSSDGNEGLWPPAELIGKGTHHFPFFCSRSPSLLQQHIEFLKPILRCHAMIISWRRPDCLLA